MNDKKNVPESAAQLRWRAEEFARHQSAESASESQPLSPEETRRTIHELRVNQIELQMQNEELRRVQAELDSARAHYYDLYDLAPVGYCILSIEGLILEVNSTAVKLLEEARSTLIRQPITRFIHKEDQDIYYLHRKRLFESNEPQACELRMVRKDGATFWIRLSATPPNSVRDTDGEPASRLVMSDITELKRVEEEKAELLAQLRKGQDSRRPGLAPRRRGDDGKIA